MCKSLQLVIILMLIVAPATQGQDGEFAPCTSADLDTLQEIESGYDALMRQAPRTGNTNLLRYLGERQYEWRLGINDDLPRCAEAIEIGWLMSQITSDAVVASALKLSEKNTDRIAESIEQGQSRLERLYDELAAELERDAAAVDSELPTACSDTQLSILAPDILIMDGEVLEQGLDVQSDEDHLQYTIAYFEWRLELWKMLPHCAEAVEFGLLINQGRSDLSAIYANGTTGLSDDENPSLMQFKTDSFRFKRVREDIFNKLDRYRTVKTYYVAANVNVDIRACGSADCELVEVLYRGDQVRVLDDSGQWYEIRLPIGQIAYINASLVDTNPPD